MKPAKQAVLWSEAFVNSTVHATPAKDNDPNATGWIALCNAFCCGVPTKEKPAANVCPICEGLL